MAVMSGVLKQTGSAERLRWEACSAAGEAPSTSACQLAGHQRWFPLGEVLGGGDVVSSDLGLLRCRGGHLFALYLGFGHVIVPRIKILLLGKGRRGECFHFLLTHWNLFKINQQQHDDKRFLVNFTSNHVKFDIFLHNGPVGSSWCRSMKTS